MSGNFDYKLSNSVTLSWYTHYTDDDRKTKQNRTFSIPSIREIKGNNERSQNVLRLDWQPDAVSTLSIWAHHQVFQSDSRTFRLDTNAQVAISRRTQELWEPQFQYTRQIGSQQLLTFGGEHDFRRARGQTLKGASTDQGESAGWIQDEISVLPWMDLVLGGRYTSNTEAGWFFSPQTTLLLKPGNFRGRFTYTRGFRSPDFGETGFNFIEAGGVGIIGNPNLSPEKSTSYTSNIEYYFEQYKAKIGASFFRHDVSDLIQFVGGSCSAAEAAGINVPLSNCFKTSNVANSRSQGFELEAVVKPFDWLYMETGYMYLDSRNLDTDSFLFTRSPHAWKSRIRVEYAGWDFTTRIRYFSSFGFSDINGNNRIDSNEKAPSNLQMDVRLSRTFRNGIEIYGGAENITESRMNVRSGSIPVSGEHLWFIGMRMAL